MMTNKNLSYNEIIDRIGYFKNKKKMSSYELSLQLGYSPNYFYKVEDHTISLSIKNLLEVLEILEVTTSEFFYYDLNKFEKDNKSISLLSSLTDEETSAFQILFKRKK